MNQEEHTENQPGLIKHTLNEISQPFIDLFHAPRPLWGINISYFLEGFTYFGMVGLLAIFFNDYVGLNDINAGQMVGFLTGGITFAMLILGAAVDIIGLRKSLLLALLLMLIGRVLITISPFIMGTSGLWSSNHILVMIGLVWLILGNGIYQPAAYAGVKTFTNEKTAAMGYAMLYAVMNLGGFLPGLVSPPVRKAFGITGVFWVFVAFTVIGMVAITFIISKKVMQKAAVNLSQEKKDELEEEEGKTFKEKMTYYMKNFPLKDLRFLFFIFILIPVQTLFAHNWLTLPMYCERAFTGIVHENFEFFVNLNPLLVFVLTPVVAALTSQKNAYKMMILGTFVMAFPTFILALGPNIYTLFGYLILMTVGEAMWQPRFLQWVAEIAPKGMTGIYMGIGQFPWFLTKIVTSLYSGWFLMNYCPEGIAPKDMNTETMWLIYGMIAMVSPVCLILAKKWMMKGFKTKAA
jgi:proton-dependent oligopeptide transporter, POT family